MSGGPVVLAFKPPGPTMQIPGRGISNGRGRGERSCHAPIDDRYFLAYCVYCVIRQSGSVTEVLPTPVLGRVTLLSLCTSFVCSWRVQRSKSSYPHGGGHPLTHMLSRLPVWNLAHAREFFQTPCHGKCDSESTLSRRERGHRIRLGSFSFLRSEAGCIDTTPWVAPNVRKTWSREEQ